jgi:hypothetical protein
VEIISFFALECGWTPNTTLEQPLDALKLLAEGIMKHKVDWISNIINSLFGKPSKKQEIVETLQNLEKLKREGLLEDA